ncbi:3-methyladenine DNA glycosylase [Neosynechococcus sphagnicola sy1]|uniref:Putative 3-methyladenine DNA glycosylase n=1 Tax=Neosynechococcus sphagnicola sy1 TaxID=1497020 RepID=A0A098TJE0_9CYAN|nr:DNA-3-methyladenine glycosylase [Neosynechococcus sphagnicola]KGF72226.1 3-methyladenine DNA glycosylase [Neosynechococcus sphagnicola sy1]
MNCPAASPVIEPEWLSRPAPEVAPDLVGCTLVRQFADGNVLRGVIVETEAYAPGDPAFHAYRGRSPRNWIVFEQAGHAYVYLIYGMYHCFNVVTDRTGIPSAVLIRALQLETPPPGIDLPPAQLHRVAAGPGKLCRVLQIDLTDNAQVLQPGGRFWLEHRLPAMQELLEQQPLHLVQTTRIGLTKGVDTPWRWYLKQSPAVSKP